MRGRAAGAPPGTSTAETALHPRTLPAPTNCSVDALKVGRLGHPGPCVVDDCVLGEQDSHVGIDVILQVTNAIWLLAVVCGSSSRHACIDLQLGRRHGSGLSCSHGFRDNMMHFAAWLRHPNACTPAAWLSTDTHARNLLPAQARHLCGAERFAAGAATALLPGQRGAGTAATRGGGTRVAGLQQERRGHGCKVHRWQGITSEHRQREPFGWGEASLHCGRRGTPGETPGCLLAAHLASGRVGSRHLGDVCAAPASRTNAPSGSGCGGRRPCSTTPWQVAQKVPT